MLIFELIAYTGIGLLAGFLAGLLGISGGIVTVPLLLLIFTWIDFPQAYVMHMAIGTSLAAMVFNTLSATWMHHRKKAVLWKVVQRMTFGIAIGSFLGAMVAHLLSGVVLEVAFGIFACCLGLYMLRGVKLQEGMHPLPGSFVLNSIGTGIGFLANILGIGGGIVTVPILMAFKINEKKAIATSSATSVLITFLGAVFYIFLGVSQKVSIHHKSIGYLYFPAFIMISVATFFAAPFGAKLTHDLPSKRLRRIFATVLFAVGLIMIFI